MKLIKYISRPCYYLMAFAMFGFTSCLPESENENLGPLPTATFEIEPVSGKVNTYLLKNTTEGAFAFFWNTGGGFQEGSAIDTAYFGIKGDYEVKLRVLSSGGISESSNTVTVEETDPELCEGVMGRLTGCGSKTWILNPDAGALFIGPVADGDLTGTAWWQNSAAEVSAPDRVCLFDDEFTFTIEGDYIFDNNGTMRVDDEAGAPWPTDIGLAIGCYDIEQIPEKYQAWGAGNHKFTATPNSLTLSGNGAHIGLYKVGDGGTIDSPKASVTYEIESITEDMLVIKKIYDWGGWRFTLKAK